MEKDAGAGHRFQGRHPLLSGDLFQSDLIPAGSDALLLASDLDPMDAGSLWAQEDFLHPPAFERPVDRRRIADLQDEIDSPLLRGNAIDPAGGQLGVKDPALAWSQGTFKGSAGNKERDLSGRDRRGEDQESSGCGPRQRLHLRGGRRTYSAS
jgi:hypothetical protein